MKDRSAGIKVSVAKGVDYHRTKNQISGFLMTTPLATYSPALSAKNVITYTHSLVPRLSLFFREPGTH